METYTNILTCTKRKNGSFFCIIKEKFYICNPINCSLPMVIQVANPVYDAVFKFLMEDMRVARTLLSALLRKEIVSVEMRRHEYSNGSRNEISMFRIDFSARVREDGGEEKLILIEVQKTWLDTETLRFRQYLGAQYSNSENMHDDGKFNRFALPMVAVYLLGHKVGDIEEPVLYVNHDSYDYYGNRVTKGLPDPFVESLVHDSIIVQIPRLRGQVNNRLDRVLSIFDQSQISDSSQHIINIDASRYDDDEEMKHVLHRLLMASSDAKLRQDMNVEDEFFRAIEDRDTAIMQRDQRIEEQKAIIAEKDVQITEKDAQITEKDAQLTEKDAQLTEKDAQITEKDAQIKEKDNMLRTMVQALQQKGMDIDSIATLTNLSAEDITHLLAP